MRDGWPKVALEEVADLSGGYAFKSKEYASSGRFVLRTLNIADNGRINRDQAVYIPLDACAPYERFELRANDILFVMVGATLGKIGLVTARDLPALLNQNMWRVRSINGAIDERFLFYAFKHCAASGLAGASGSARLFVRRDDYRRLEIPLPPIEDQEAIGYILSALDDKIDLNRRMNETLEAMARAIFKDWFVDFGPTRAKMEGRAPYLTSEIWALFPDRLNDEGTPKGWDYGQLGDVVEQRVERTHPSAETAVLPYVPIDCITSNALTLMESKSGAEAQSSLTKFYKNDFVFGAMRPYFHKVCIAPFDGTTRTTAFVLRPKSQNDFSFACLRLHHPDTIDYATRHSTGSTIPYAVWGGSLENMPAIIPPKDIRKAFDILIRPILLKLPETYFENKTLAAIRDHILPKLLSGEIRVKEAEKNVQAVA